MARLTKVSGLIIFILGSLATVGAKSDSAAGQSPAQQTAPVPESATVLRATTRLVVVDVVATDHKGAPITGLKREDFTVLEDGKEQEIRVFSLQQPAPALPGSAVRAAAPRLPANVFTNIPRYRNTSALNVVLLDALNTTVPHQAYVREQMLRYLAKMPEGQPLAIYLLGSKLTLLQDFTSDPAVLKGVVRKLKGNVSPVLDNPAGGQDVELLPPGVADSGMVPESMLQAMMSFEQERTSFQLDLRVSYTLAAMSALAHALSGYPGRKNLIWVSEAFPIGVDPNLELTGDVFAGTRNYGPQITEAAQALMDSQVAIYPVDARGLESSALFDASNSGRDKFGRSLSIGGRMGAALSQESAQLQDVHSAMNDLADRTGGKAFYNRNDIDGAIRQGIEDGSTYYTLAYYPSNKNWNGKFRKIKVKVDREGIKLSYRLGYYAVDPKVFTEHNSKQQAQLFAEALSLDSPVATGLTFAARVWPPSTQTRGKVRVDYHIDPHAISFSGRNDGLHHATIECVAQAYTAKGRLLKTEVSTITASLKPATYTRTMQTNFPCQTLIDLPPGSYVLRLGVRDDGTGLMGTANGKVVVGQASAPWAK